MVEKITYTEQEFAALQEIAEINGGGLTREMLEEYGTKLTPDELSLLFDQSETVFDPFENVDEDAAPSRGGRRQFEEASSWLKLNMRIKGALDRGEEPLGVPFHMVSKEQWEAAIGGQIGENLIRFIAGVSAEQGAHFNSAHALIRRQKKSSKKVDVEITQEQLNELIAEKIMDIDVPFRALANFLYAVNDLRKKDAEKVFPQDNRLSMFLAESNTDCFTRHHAQLAAELLLPKDEEGKPYRHHLNMWFQKARAADRGSEIKRQEPLIQRSEHLVVAVWAAVEGALENYIQGPMLKSELPRAAEILQLLDGLDPTHEKKPSLQNTFQEKFNHTRKVALFNHNCIATEEEWDFFQNHLGISDARIEQLKQLPAGVDPKLNLPSPEYTLKHPEHYETFGKWLKAMRQASGITFRDVTEKLGKTKQAIEQTEEKNAENLFRTLRGQIPIPEQYLNADPYGIFPKDKEFRARFLALSEPNVMKRQYEEAQNWITHPQMMKELGLEWDYTLHREVLHYWRQDTIGVENGKRGTIAIRGGYIDVMRDTEGDLRFHKSSVDKLKADPEIQAHIARQKEHGVER